MKWKYHFSTNLLALLIVLVGLINIFGCSPKYCRNESAPMLWSIYDLRRPAVLQPFLSAIWGVEPENFFVVGRRCLYHWYNSKWSNVNDVNINLQNNKVSLHGIWGSGLDDVFVVGGYFSGFQTTYGTYYKTTYLNYNSDAMILHYNGKAWERMNVPTKLPLNDIWGSSPNNVFAVGGYYEVVDDDRGDFVGKENVILHYNGFQWTKFDKSAHQITATPLYGIWGSGHNDVFAVGGYYGVVRWRKREGYAVILHYNGSTWQNMDVPSVPSGGPLRDVWGTGPDNVFAVGDSGIILHYNGWQWSRMKNPFNPQKGSHGKRYIDLFSIWGSNPNNIFAVGEKGLILHYDRNSWKKMTGFHYIFKEESCLWLPSLGYHYEKIGRGCYNDLFGIWGSDDNHVVSVGEGGLIYKYNGNAWETEILK